MNATLGREHRLPQRWRSVFAIALGVFILVGSPLLGAAGYSVDELLYGEGATTFLRLRLPRVALGFLAGGILAISGLIFQAIFRNGLAEPYTLGVATGAACGSYLAAVGGIPLLLPAGLAFFFPALLGAIFSVGILALLSTLSGLRAPGTLTLAGVSTNAFFSSIILTLQYSSDMTQLFKATRWLLGGVETIDFGGSLFLAPSALLAGILLWRVRFALDLIAHGDDFAQGRGVDVHRLRWCCILGVSLLVGCVVSVVGPLGFIGLIVPHIGRTMFGATMRKLLPWSFWIGGCFLVFCDAIGRVIIAPTELPVGIITSLLGAPFFIWILIRGSGR